MSTVPDGRYAEVGDGLRLHYHEAGPRDGRPVIFVHGSGPGASGWSNFKHNYPYLAERGLRAIVPDLPGYGYSGKPTDVPYTLDWLAGTIARFAGTLGITKTALIGNSLGGAISTRVALDRPELVERLVLMAPGGLEEREVYMRMPGIQAMTKAFFAKGGVTREGLIDTFRLQLFDPTKVSDELIEERYQIAITQPTHVVSSMRVPNLTPELPKLRCPVLGFWGVNDQFCPVEGALRIAQGVKRCRMILLSECGHWVMVEHRDRFNRETLEFLIEAAA